MAFKYLNQPKSKTLCVLIGLGLFCLFGCTKPVGKFTTAPELATSRTLASVVTLKDGRILVIGGVQSKNPQLLDTAELYDPKTRRFTTCCKLHHPRLAFTAELLQDGRVLIAGGNVKDKMVAPAELFLPDQNKFIVTDSMRHPRIFHTSTLLPNGQVALIGGMFFSNHYSEEIIPTIEFFDPKTNRFIAGPKMIEPRKGHCSALLGNTVMIVGGKNQQQSNSYNPWPDTRTIEGLTVADKRTFAYPKHFPISPAHKACVQLDDNSLLVFGGIGRRLKAVPDAFVIESQPFGIYKTKPLQVPRIDATSIRLNNRYTLIAGGLNIGNPNNNLNSAELFDKTTGEFKLTEQMPFSVVNGQAVLTTDNQALVIGSNLHVSPNKQLNPKSSLFFRL